MTWKREQRGRYTSGAYTIRRTWRGEEVRWLLLHSGTQVDNAPTLAGAKRFADRREGLEVEVGKTRPCTSRRCDKGTVWLASGMPITCGICLGTTRVACAADRDESEREGQRISTALGILDAAARTRDGHHNGKTMRSVWQARGLLRDLEYDRFLKMVASIEGGRVEAVIDALIAYEAAWQAAEEAKHAAAVSA